MSREEQQQKMKTSFQFRDAVGAQEFEHQTMEPQQFERELRTIRTHERETRELWARMRGETLPEGQMAVQTAQLQGTVPQAAPRETTWKERRAQKKQRQNDVKRGRELTREADALTADLAACQRQIRENPNRFVAPSGAENQGLEGLTKVLRSMQSVTVTADQFTDEQLVRSCAFLRETLDKSAYIAQMTQDETLMERLKAADLGLYATALRWRDTEPELRQLFRLANHCHGLTESGEPMGPQDLSESRTVDGVEEVIPNLAHHARKRFGAALENFRGKLADQETARQDLLAGVMEQAYEQELERMKEDVRQSGEQERQWAEASGILYGTPEYLERIQSVKTLIEENGQRYLENKELLDRMYSDLLRRLEVLGELRLQVKAWGLVQIQHSDYQSRKGSDSFRILRRVTQELERVQRESQEVSGGVEAIESAMSKLLLGKQAGTLEIAVLSRYGYDAVNPLKTALSARQRRTEWQNAALERLKAQTRAGTTGLRLADLENPYVTRGTALFYQGEENAGNLSFVNVLRKYEAEKNWQPAARQEGMSDGAYERAREEECRAHRAYYVGLEDKVEQTVWQLMLWDIERFQRMDEGELMMAQEELDALLSAAQFVTELMTIRNPVKPELRMKEDLLGDALDEYEHRLAVLRGLVDKAQGLALGAMLAAELPVADCMTPEELYSKLPALAEKNHVAADSPEAFRLFAQAKLEAGTRLLESEEASWKDLRNEKSERFREAFGRLYQRKPSVEALDFEDSALSAAAREVLQLRFLEGEASPEETAILKRLKDEDFRLAGADYLEGRIYCRELGRQPESTKREDLPISIGTNFFSLLKYYAVKKGADEQTPEEFRQMIRDLSAGAELTRENAAPQQIFEARERNRRGLMQYKETLRVQYAYLSRKYGFALEKAPLMEVYDHWEELLRDFGSVQADWNLSNRISEFYDPDNPEDMRLKRQVDYLGRVVLRLQGMGKRVAAGESIEEAVMDRDASSLIFLAKRALERDNLGTRSAAEKVAWGTAVEAPRRRQVSQEDARAKEARWQRFQEREALREQESQRMELQKKWIRNGKVLVYYPDEYTEQLYESRKEEISAFKARKKAVRECLMTCVKKYGGQMPRRWDHFLAMMPRLELDKDGRLHGEEEKRLQKLAEDYFFRGEEGRRQAADAMLEQLCGLELSVEMFHPDYIRAHYTEMVALSRLAGGVKEVIDENAVYFQELERQTPEITELLSQVNGVLTTVGEWVDNTMITSGLAVHAGELNFESVGYTQEKLMKLWASDEPDIQAQMKKWTKAKADYLQKRGQSGA